MADNADMNDGREDGMLNSSKKPCSPLDVEGVDLGVTTEEIVGFVREGRSRYGDAE